MSLKLHDSTNIGIEIEICMKKDFYKSLQSKKKNFTQVYKYPKGQDPFRKNYPDNSYFESDLERKGKGKNSVSESNSGSNSDTGSNTNTGSETNSGSNTNTGSNTGSNTESGTNSNSYSSSESSNMSLRDIVLTEDLTCKCPNDTYINAEINSPRMNSKDIKHFMRFLEEKLFKDRKQFYQGTTCGIHIHWSNEKLQLFKNIPEYNFEFIKVMFFLKKYLSYKVIHKDFSGREHFYDKLKNEIDFVLIPKSYRDKFPIIKSMKFNLKGNMNLEDVKTLVENEPVEYLEWLEELDTDKKKILAFIETLTPSEYSDLVFIHLLIVQKFKKPTVYNKHYGLEHQTGDVKSIQDLDVEVMVDFFNQKRKELLADPRVRESVETVIVLMIKKFGEPDMWKNSKFCINFRKLITEAFKRSLKDSDYFKNKGHEEEFFRLLHFINLFKNVLISSKTNFNYNKYGHFWERIMSKSSIPMGKVKNEFILKKMVNHFYKQPICLYDLQDFHMELRVFSLDDLFTRQGKSVTGNDITKELYRFLEMTDTLMSNVIDRLNKFFDEGEKGIPRSRMETYQKFFLMDREYSAGDKMVRKRFDELLGIERKKTKSLKPSLKLGKGVRGRISRKKKKSKKTKKKK